MLQKSVDTTVNMLIVTYWQNNYVYLAFEMLHLSSYTDTLSKFFRVACTYPPTKTKELSKVFRQEILWHPVFR